MRRVPMNVVIGCVMGILSDSKRGKHFTTSCSGIHLDPRSRDSCSGGPAQEWEEFDERLGWRQRGSWPRSTPTASHSEAEPQKQRKRVSGHLPRIKHQPPSVDWLRVSAVFAFPSSVSLFVLQSILREIFARQFVLLRRQIVRR